MNKPETKEKCRQSAIKHWSKPGAKEEHSKIMKKAMNTPEVKENLKQGQIKYWSKPGVREEHSKNQKIVMSKPKARENNRQAQIKRFSKPGVRERSSKTQKKAHNTPEAIENHKQGALKRWDNYTPKERENFLRKTVFKGNRSPNVSEGKLIPMLGSFGFHYNGNGPLIISNKIPDFVHKIFPLLIEFDGYAGHNPTCLWVPDNKPQLDDLRDSIYRAAGYNILRLFPEDLQTGKEHVQNKVKEWMEPFEYRRKVIEGLRKL